MTKSRGIGKGVGGGRPTNPLDNLMVFKSGSFFKTENELCDFLELNKELFCKKMFGSKLSESKREFSVTQQVFFGTGRSKRIDFLFILEDGTKIGVECKCSDKNYSLINAVGQILQYQILYPFDKIVILSGFFDATVLEIVEKYNLPIEFIFLNKDFTLQWKK